MLQTKKLQVCPSEACPRGSGEQGPSIKKCHSCGSRNPGFAGAGSSRDPGLFPRSLCPRRRVAGNQDYLNKIIPLSLPVIPAQAGTQ